jgi:AraC-like DNA-binding protein
MLLYVSIFTILLSLILLFNNWKINTNVLYLSLFLIIASIYGIAHYLVLYGKSPFWLAIFYNHFTPLMLLLGPLLFFYVRGTLDDSSVLKKSDSIHCIPAVIHLAGIIPYSLQDFSNKLEIASMIINDIDTIIGVQVNILYNASISFIIRPVLLFAYILACMYLIWKRFSVSNFDHNIPKRQLLVSFRWLIILIVSLFFIVIEFLIITFNSIQHKPSIGLVNSYPLYILSGVAYFIMSFSLLLFPTILYGIPKRVERKDKKKKVKLKKQVDTIQEETVSLEEDPFFELSESIKVYLEEEQPFLNPDFSISDIALHIKAPQNHVSYCITQLMGTKFSKLKSELRIKYALELLKNGSNSLITIEAIGKQSGFKTRSNFYSAFKDETGFTPTEYINNELK